jgi:hypothetical protein
MNEDDVVRIVRSYIEGLFPKICPTCGRRYGSLREYLKSTSHLGTPMLYETIAGKALAEPMGPIAFANCACGTTLTIGSRGIPRAQMAELMEWARSESSKRSIGVQELLGHLRERIDAAVLGDENPGDAQTGRARPRR